MRVSTPRINTWKSIWKLNEPPSPKPSPSQLSPLNRCVGKQMKTFFNGSNPCERKILYCQKCEVTQRPRAANGAEHRSTGGWNRHTGNGTRKPQRCLKVIQPMRLQLPPFAQAWGS